MTVFENGSRVSPENTAVAIQLALDKAETLSADVVVSTSSGASALALVEAAADRNFKGRIVVVTLAYGWKSGNYGENLLPDETRKALEDSGALVITATHILSGVERAISQKFGGISRVEMMAQTFKMISEGMKVCVEISSMALDAGALKLKCPVVALGGTSSGLDTACVITPGFSEKIFETRVHEILCKPY